MGIEERIERIKEMEEAFDQAVEALDDLEEALDDFEEEIPNIHEVIDYYGSDEWFEDRDADEAGELPEDLKRGVLGEDLPYDALVAYHDIAIRMLEIATRALKY